MRHCPRCSSEISKNDKSCPRCGLAVDKMDEFEKNFTFTEEVEQIEEKQEEKEEKVLSKKEQKKIAKAEKKAKKKAAKKEREEEILNEDTQFFKFAKNSGEENPDIILDTDSYFEKKKKRKRQAAKPVFVIDENGKFHIDTKDVELVGDETGRIIGERYEQSYSIKKERGDYIPPRIKWWEIYKLADRYFVRRKIKKEVNKAAKIKPKFVKKSKILLLSIFLGWCGAHNFYARNKNRGWTSIVTLIIWFGVIGLAAYSPFFASIQISVGGCAGFINMFMWIADIINISTNTYKYKIQRDKFIGFMNVETRAKLGEKYIDMELYHKPWWVRFKVWWQKTKKNYQEYKRDKRQRNIDKQKRKLAMQEEKNKIENDIAEFERKENEKLAKKDSQNVVSQEMLEEIKSFDDEDDTDDLDNDDSNSNEEIVEQTEDETEEVKDEEKEAEETQNQKKSHVEPYRNKYAKFSNNKKSKKKKK